MRDLQQLVFVQRPDHVEVINEPSFRGTLRIEAFGDVHAVEARDVQLCVEISVQNSIAEEVAEGPRPS